VVLSTKGGMAIRFSEADAREMGRNTKGVKGINLRKEDALVGMVVADPDGFLLTICENGYGKRTPFGPNTADIVEEIADDETVSREAEPSAEADPAEEPTEGDEATADKSTMRYRRQRRGGKGVRDVRVTDKNGKVVGIAAVKPGDELMLTTMQGMVTRSRADDIRLVGRNTQGVRVMNLGDGDRVASLAKMAGEAAETEA